MMSRLLDSIDAAAIHAAVCRRFDLVDHVYLVLTMEQATLSLSWPRMRNDDLITLLLSCYPAFIPLLKSLLLILYSAAKVLVLYLCV